MGTQACLEPLGPNPRHDTSLTDTLDDYREGVAQLQVSSSGIRGWSGWEDHSSTLRPATLMIMHTEHALSWCVAEYMAYGRRYRFGGAESKEKGKRVPIGPII